MKNDAVFCDAQSGGSLTIRLDGTLRHIVSGVTLAQLVAALGHEDTAVGTALNGEFVPRTARAGHVLAEDDAVLLFQPIVGG